MELTLFLLAAFVVAILARNRSKRLETRIQEIYGRVLDLELKQAKLEKSAPTSASTATPRPAAPVAPPAIVAPRPPVPAPSASPASRSAEEFPQAAEARPSIARTAAAGQPAPRPRPASTEPVTPSSTPPTQRRDIGALEAAIGGSWLNKIGVALLVIGIAFALGYSLTILGPGGKALLATAISFALLGAGVLLERRETYRLYGRGLIAGGWATLYATAYAVHELEATRIVESPLAGFALLILVGAGMIFHSLRYDNEGITSLAYALAYAAIALHSISAYTLVAGAILGLGTVAHLLRRQWHRLAFGGIVATYGCLFLWYTRQGAMTIETLKLGLGALLLDWIVFLVADFAPEPANGRQRQDSQAVALINAFAAGGLAWLAWSKFSHEGTWMPLALLGAVYAATSGTLRKLGRASVHPMHSLAAALLLGFAAREAFDVHGATWAWLAEAQGLVLLGVLLKDRFHRMLGSALFLAPAAAIFHDQIGERLDRVEGIWDPPRFALTLAACAAFYLTFARLKAFAPDDREGRIEEAIRRGFSYGAFAVVAVGLWVQLPRVYVAPAGAVLMLLLFEMSSLRLLVDLRIQTYLASAFTIAAALALTAPSADLLAGHAARLPALAAVATSYFVLFLRRRTERSTLVDFDAQARTALPWLGSAFAALVVWLEARPVMVGPAWILLALVLVETGIALRESALRRPGYALLVGGHISLVLSNLTATDLVSGWSIRAVTVIPAIAASCYLWWRLREIGGTPGADATDEGYGRFLAYATGIMTGLFVRFEFGLEGAALRWSLAMVALFAAGYLLRDADFRIQAYALALASFVRAVGFDLEGAPPVLGVDGPLAVAAVSVLCFIGVGLFLRSRLRAGDRSRDDRRTLPIEATLEPRGFDVMSCLAVGVAAVYSYHSRSGFMLIVAWAVEGLLATAAGFLLEARTLRLAGLGLLSVGLAMTLYRTVTTFDTIGRIVSFLVLGVVLLLVSFGYTKYRGVLRKTS